MISLHKVFHRNDFFRSLLLSYMIIIIVAACIALAGYHMAYDSLVKNSESANMEMLRQGRNIMDQKLSTLSDELSAIATNPTIEDISQMNPSDLSYMQLNNAVKILKDYQFNLDQNYIYDYYVYFPSIDYLVTSDTAYTSDFYYQSVAERMSISYSEWLTLMKSPHNSSHTVPVTAFYNNHEIHYLPYMMSFPFSSQTIDGNAVMILNLSDLQSLFSNIDLSKGGWIYIQDDQGNTITTITRQKKGVEYPRLETEKAASGFRQQTINGTRMIVSYVVSSKNNWQYVIVLPEETVLGQVNAYKKILIVMISFLFFSVFLMALWMAYHNSKPISSIVDHLHSLTGYSVPKEETTVNIIHNSITALATNNQRMRKEIELQKPRLIMNFILQVLKGNYNSWDELQSDANFIDITVKKSCRSIVMVIRVYTPEREKFGQNMIKQSNIIKIALKKILQVYLESHFLTYDPDLNSMVIILWDKNDHSNELSESIRKFCSVITNQSDFEILMGIGTVQESMLTVWKSYIEATETLSFLKLHKWKKHMTYQEVIKYGTQQIFYYPVDVEQRLILCAQSGNVEQVKQILAYILDENLNNRVLPNHMTSRLFEEMKGTLLKIAHQTGPDETVCNEIDELDYDQALENRFSNIVQLFIKICENEMQKSNSHGQLDIREVIRFIKENYSNSNLSLTYVASEFRISESYLSIYFKKKMSMNFIEYVEKLRMKEADRLLHNTDLSIADICGKVGYNSAQSFRRAFKRLMGVTPNMIRNTQKL